MDLSVLPTLVGKVVDLHFKDGHVVRARLVHVDLDAPAEIIYDVLEIVEVGPAKFQWIEPGNVLAVDPSDLVIVTSL